MSILVSCQGDDNQAPNNALFQLSSAMVGTIPLKATETVAGVGVDQPLVLRFNLELDITTVDNNVVLKDESENPVPLQSSYLDQNRTISAKPISDLQHDHIYRLELGDIQTIDGTKYGGASFNFKTAQGVFDLVSITIDGVDFYTTPRMQNVGFDFQMEVNFSTAVKTLDLTTFVSVNSSTTSIPLDLVLTNNNTALTITPKEPLDPIRKYVFSISDLLESGDNRIFQGFSKEFYTKIDPTPKFPPISDEELLTLVQEQTFKYFWDFAHPISGLARERNTSVETVTSGGSGFGIMALLVGVERGFISRAQGTDRLEIKIDFLAQADRFHGAWSHWLNGTTGKVVPFSSNDDGGDLVETSYLAMGLITARQYLNPNDAQELELINKINDLWEGIEWDWYTQNENSLTWHWSPQFAWEKNLKIRGWNEALITYIMAAASPTHTISKTVYDEGWARGGAMVNGQDFYGITLPLGKDQGGPLFFEHYTFLGVDPRNLSDQYANYWDQAVNHTLINREHCIMNPRNYVGYSAECWGLTASDGKNSYSAHSPTNDRGVITPTAALSSFPYTPDHSSEALKHFYYILGDKLWGAYGFYDAFNLTEEWIADSYLAIDQGPILLMIENHRSGLLWDLFMSAPEIQNGLTKLEFTY